MDHHDDSGQGPPVPGQVLDSPPTLVQNTVGHLLERDAVDEAPPSTEPTQSTSGSILSAPLALQQGADSLAPHLGTALEPPLASNAGNEIVAMSEETGPLPASLNPTSANQSNATTVETNHEDANSSSGQDHGGSSHASVNASLNVPVGSRTWTKVMQSSLPSQNFEAGQSHLLNPNPGHGSYNGTRQVTMTRCSNRPGPVPHQEVSFPYPRTFSLHS